MLTARDSDKILNGRIPIISPSREGSRIDEQIRAELSILPAVAERSRIKRLHIRSIRNLNTYSKIKNVRMETGRGKSVNKARLCTGADRLESVYVVKKTLASHP